jgi:hypothetical protein
LEAEGEVVEVEELYHLEEGEGQEQLLDCVLLHQRVIEFYQLLHWLHSKHLNNLALGQRLKQPLKVFVQVVVDLWDINELTNYSLFDFAFFHHLFCEARFIQPKRRSAKAVRVFLQATSLNEGDLFCLLDSALEIRGHYWQFFLNKVWNEVLNSSRVVVYVITLQVLQKGFNSLEVLFYN